MSGRESGRGEMRPEERLPDSLDGPPLESGDLVDALA